LSISLSEYSTPSLIHVICYLQRCHNPNLGLTTKARACKRARQEGDLGGTPYTPWSAGKRERMNLHTPKATPTWGVKSPEGFPNLQGVIAVVKTHWFEDLFISLKSY
jgi:hypothetical protein